MIVAILNLHNTPMPPTKFGLNLTGFRSGCGFKIFKMATQAAILDSGMHNSESLCHSNPTYGLGEKIKEFQDGHHGGHLG